MGMTMNRLLYPGMSREAPDSAPSAGSVAGLFLSTGILAGCLTMLYLGMRGVMELGGMVASGGPYAIEHPAPDWVWVVPVSIFAGLASAFASFVFHRSTGGPGLHFLAWPALFTSLGYNFLDFGLNPPGDGTGFAWGWLICAALFLVMGLGPLVFIVKGFRTRSEDRQVSFSGNSLLLLLWNLLAVALGIWGASSAFRALSG
jgi:hypothetical protein